MAVCTDLHCHSRYSDQPEEWLLRRLGTHESYTSPEALYYTARKLGMDLVSHRRGPESLAQAILDLVRDPERRTRMGSEESQQAGSRSWGAAFLEFWEDMSRPCWGGKAAPWACSDRLDCRPEFSPQYSRPILAIPAGMAKSQ